MAGREGLRRLPNRGPEHVGGAAACVGGLQPAIDPLLPLRHQKSSRSGMPQKDLVPCPIGPLAVAFLSNLSDSHQITVTLVNSLEIA
jgi:hypothetical protein